MLWIAPEEKQTQEQMETTPTYFHAYSIANNFFGRDHVILFWSCVSREKGGPLYEKIAPNISRYSTEQQGRIKDYIDHLFSKKEVVILKDYLSRQFGQTLIPVPEQTPLHPQQVESGASWDDIVSTGIFTWEMPESFMLKSGFHAKAVYDLRIAMPITKDSIDMRPTVLDKIDVGAARSK